ncbi:MAG: hypothetical protein ACE5FA_14690, partial [Dehalococcoidia bacterium]
LPYADLEDGVQRIDPYTDTRGRRTFCAVTPGVVTVTARYGNRRDVRTLKVADGRLTRAPLVLPTPLPTPRPEPKADARPGSSRSRKLSLIQAGRSDGGGNPEISASTASLMNWNEDRLC